MPASNQELREHLAHCIEHGRPGVFVNPGQGDVYSLPDFWQGAPHPPELLNWAAADSSATYNLFGDLSDAQVIDLAFLLSETDRWMAAQAKHEVTVVLELILMAMRDATWPNTHENLIRACAAYSTGDLSPLWLSQPDESNNTALRYILDKLASETTGPGERTRFMLGRMTRRLKTLKNKFLGIQLLTGGAAAPSFLSVFHAPRCVIIEMSNQESSESLRYQSAVIRLVHQAAKEHEGFNTKCQIWGLPSLN